VNQQLAALKSQQSVDDRMGKLLSENKDLTIKLASAQKEIAHLNRPPAIEARVGAGPTEKSSRQFDASQAANKALQQTTTTLQQQLDQAQADLVVANQKLAAAAGSPSTIHSSTKTSHARYPDAGTSGKAHRDMAKRLAQEEFDNLKLKSKVLQEQLDILGSPMTLPPMIRSALSWPA